MPKSPSASVFAQRLARELRFDPSRFIALKFGARQIGWLRPALAARLKEFSEIFQCNEREIGLISAARLPDVLKALEKEGFIPGWRNELHRIGDFFDIERAAARPFGLTTHAVHVNGVAADGMWIARRSAAKPVDPGMLDNLVGGGLTAGLSEQEVLVKEAWEEAGIPPDLARAARRQASVSLLREVPEGVQSEVIHVYDLELPAAFVPRNQDGEVSELRKISFEEAIRRIRDTEELTLDAALVARDYFSRRGNWPD
jgi:8-oxo-dGTP pyrophosphatase MutT (NUDIX family)